MYIHLTIKYINANGTVNAPVRGFDVPTNFSEQEMFACFTCADSWNESDSPCEPYSAPKPTINDWSIPASPNVNTRTTIYTAVFLAALYKYKYNARTLGFLEGHVLNPPDEPAAKKPVVLEIVHPIQYGIAPKRLLLSHSDTLRSSRTLTTTSRPYEPFIQLG